MINHTLSPDEELRLQKATDNWYTDKGSHIWMQQVFVKNNSNHKVVLTTVMGKLILSGDEHQITMLLLKI